MTNVVADGAQLVPPEARGVGMVFQCYALEPHVTVAGNVAFALVVKRPLGRAEIATKVDALERVGFGGRTPRRCRRSFDLHWCVWRGFAIRPTMTGTNELHDMQFQLALREAENRLAALRGDKAGVSLPESAALARLLKAGVKPDEAANRVHAGKARRSGISLDFK